MEDGKAVPVEEEQLKKLYFKDADLFSEIVTARPKLFETQPTGGGRAPEGDAVKQFMDKAEATSKERKIRFADAMIVLSEEDPELYKAYRDETGRDK